MKGLKKNRKIGRILKLTSGWILFILGILGLFLPFLQGILMILAGLAILSTEYKWARKLRKYLKGKWKNKLSQLSSQLKNKVAMN